VEVSFDVAGFLVERRSPILANTDAEVIGRRLPHYAAAGVEEITERLAALFDVVVAAATENRLDAALAYADHIAVERQHSGHDLSEVQLAINALEEQLWHAVMEDAPVDAQGLALGMVSTILGAIKDRLACAFVSRASGKPVHTLRIDELFRGTAAGQA
jgi:hypothetical protein